MLCVNIWLSSYSSCVWKQSRVCVLAISTTSSTPCLLQVALCYASVAGAYDRLTDPEHKKNLHVFQFLFYFSAFFALFGSHTTSFLLSAEVTPQLSCCCQSPIMLLVSLPNHPACVSPQLSCLYHSPTILLLSTPNYVGCVTPQPSCLYQSPIILLVSLPNHLAVVSPQLSCLCHSPTILLVPIPDCLACVSSSPSFCLCFTHSLSLQLV